MACRCILAMKGAASATWCSTIEHSSMSAIGASASSQDSLMTAMLAIPASAARSLSSATESSDGSTTVTRRARVARGRAYRPRAPAHVEHVGVLPQEGVEAVQHRVVGAMGVQGPVDLAQPGAASMTAAMPVAVPMSMAVAA